MGIEGAVFLSFIVDQQGSISDIEVSRGIGGDVTKKLSEFWSLLQMGTW